MDELHKKQVGALGEAKVAADLMGRGWMVFTEWGDLSKVDLIALDESYHPIKIQVKSLSAGNTGKVDLSRRKSGPGYTFHYQRHHADVYAVYVYDRDLICYVAAEELMKVSRTFTLRVDPPQNGQVKNIRLVQDYFDFKRALRD